MRLTIDTDRRELVHEDGAQRTVLPLYGREAFELVERQWVRLGWNLKATYRYTWLGRPIVQLPQDMVRVQEVIHGARPDVIIETGVAMGGSLVYYASLLQLLGRGRVVGIDIEVRPHNRAAIAAHPLAGRITLVDGSSVAPETVARVRGLVAPGERVMVILDSCHTRAHVAAELEAYAPLVTPGCHLVVQDAIMADLHDVPRGRPEWATDHPGAAVDDFLARHPEFVRRQPAWPFDESQLVADATHWPGGWLLRTP